MVKAVHVKGWNPDWLPLVRKEERELVEKNAENTAQLINITTEFWELVDEELLGIFGAVHGGLLRGDAYVWFLPTDHFSRRHVRDAVSIFGQWAAGFKHLRAHCYSRRNARYLEFSGFKSIDGELYEREN